LEGGKKNLKKILKMPLVLIMSLGKLGEWGKFPRFLRVCWCLLMGQI
jgi:hypothetical protein